MIKNTMAILRSAAAVATLAAVASVSACTSDDTQAGCAAGCPAGCPAIEGDLQTPPQGSDAVIAAWIAAGSYQGAGWRCEAAVHDARMPSPHGKNKICNNTKVTQTVAPATYPFGAANVKTLYGADGTTVVGHAVALKLFDGPSDGSKWYYYEIMGGSVVANGKGKSDNSDLCASCHQGTGSDAMHSGRDFVYTQVP